MDHIETLLSFLGTLITYILLWIFNPGHQYKEVQEGRMLSPNFERGRVFKSNRKRYLKESYVMLSDKQKEFDTNDEKCKNLLTISTFLLAAQVVIWGQMDICLLACVPIFFSICVVFLLLMRDRVGIIHYCDPRQYLFEKVKIKKLQKEMINDIDEVLYNNNCVIRYKIGVYSAARRSMVLSVVCTAGLFFYFSWIHNNNVDKNTDKPRIVEFHAN